jgi:hypothetical protein
MNRPFHWLTALSWSALSFAAPLQSAKAQTNPVMFLLCRSPGAFLRLNVKPDPTGGLLLQGYGAAEDVIFNISGKANLLIEAKSYLSLPTSPEAKGRAVLQPTIQFRTLDAAAQGQSKSLGQLQIRDIRAYANETNGYFSDSAEVSLLLDEPFSLPRVSLPERFQSCYVANLTTIRKSLKPPTGKVYSCICQKTNAMPEQSAEPTSGPVFTDLTDKTGRSCQISPRTMGNLACAAQ